MAKPGVVYPQIDAAARGLMDRRVRSGSASLRVHAALDEVERSGAEVLVLGPGRAVRRRELERASDWGLGRLRAGAMAWRLLPVVTAGTPEAVVRRALFAGAPMVLVREAGRVIGVIDGERTSIARPAFSLAHRLDRLDSRRGEAALWLCRVAGKIGEGLGVSTYAVGGLVRDLLLDRPSPDVDIAVEGDGVAFAHRLREEIGGTVVVHRNFGTASIEGACEDGPASFGRIDIASARRERYRAPGALPNVSAAGIEEDLRRRDFSVNAMAMALSPGAFGRLLDPLGGQRDARARRLRPLSPLSFIEDPTRIFRAARYASRLGFALDETGVQALKLALSVGEFAELSGDRLRAEIEWLAKERSGWRGLGLLRQWGALTLWDRGYRRTPRGRTLLAMAQRFCAWADREAIAVDPSAVALIALLADQPARVAIRCLGRLGLRGAPMERAREAIGAASLARRLDGASLRRRSEVADALALCPPEVLVGAWLQGGRRARHRVQWFWSRGKAIRPHLRGDDLVALGVPPGPDVGRCLEALRRRRLDGAVTTITDEHRFVEDWLGARAAERDRGGSRNQRRSV
ncbi:MAG: hypothetical protein C5B48_16060, partial [Candidatus Rokuibacteriota bacterium]